MSLTLLHGITPGLLEALQPLMCLQINLEARCQEEMDMVREERQAAVDTADRQLARIDNLLQVSSMHAEQDMTQESCFLCNPCHVSRACNCGNALSKIKHLHVTYLTFVTDPVY